MKRQTAQHYQKGSEASLRTLLSEHPDRAFSLAEIKENLPKTGESTLYRLVASLIESGEVRKIPDPLTRHTSYQYIGGGACRSHLHLKCTSCGRVIHLPGDISEFISYGLRQNAGFSLDEGESLLFGVCAGCAGEKGHA